MFKPEKEMKKKSNKQNYAGYVVCNTAQLQRNEMIPLTVHIYLYA